jgi:uncharacterized protein
MKFGNKIHLEYNDVISMCNNLEHHVSKFKPDYIVGIVRGGLLPALHLSHAVDRPLITIKWSTRDNKSTELSTQLQDLIYAGKRVVFVDDINDTGTTFTQIKESYQISEHDEVMFASLVSKSNSLFQVDAAALTILDDRWIIFPWEKD